MKIKVKILRDGVNIPYFIDKGEWVDLCCAKKTTIVGPMKKNDSNSITFNNTLIPLGIAMELPKQFEAYVVPRSSTYKHYGIIQSNSFGVIDNDFNGDTDEWTLPVIAMKKTTIPFNDRICQFRIQPSQRSNVFTKLRWLFTSKIKFVVVDSLNNKGRGGIGSTGRK